MEIAFIIILFVQVMFLQGQVSDLEEKVEELENELFYDDEKVWYVVKSASINSVAGLEVVETFESELDATQYISHQSNADELQVLLFVE